MGYLDNSLRRRAQYDVDAAVSSPFAVVTSAVEDEALSLVRAAVREKRMRLAFQPAVYAADPGIIGFYEGYIRLLDQSGRVIPASAFMGRVEAQELGREIDVAALQLGLQTLVKNPGIRISVNMSARSVGYKPFAQTLRNAMQRHPQIGRGLILEINEASAMQMPDVLMPFMAEWRSHGLTFTLDDFGDGITSLGLMNDYAFDIAKIDQRFVRGCDRLLSNQSIIRVAVSMAQEFGMFLVAEAVETTEEANWLAQQGVGCLQGYLFGKPQVSPDFSAFRKGRSP